MFSATPSRKGLSFLVVHARPTLVNICVNLKAFEHNFATANYSMAGQPPCEYAPNGGRENKPCKRTQHNIKRVQEYNITANVIKHTYVASSDTDCTRIPYTSTPTAPPASPTNIPPPYRLLVLELPHLDRLAIFNIPPSVGGPDAIERTLSDGLEHVGNEDERNGDRLSALRLMIFRENGKNEKKEEGDIGI